MAKLATKTDCGRGNVVFRNSLAAAADTETVCCMASPHPGRFHSGPAPAIQSRSSPGHEQSLGH
jgi:hypothetical protein